MKQENVAWNKIRNAFVAVLSFCKLKPLKSWLTKYLWSKKRPNNISALSQLQDDRTLHGSSVLKMYNSEKKIKLGWLIQLNYKLFTWKKKNISSGTCTLANISHVNKLLITVVEQDFIHRAGNTVDTCWGSSCDWSVAVGVSAFRKELSAEAQVGEGTVASVQTPPQWFPEGQRSIAREQGCRTCSSVRRSDWCVCCMCKWLLKETRSSWTFRDLLICQSNTAYRLLVINQGCRLFLWIGLWLSMLENNKQSRLQAKQAEYMLVLFSFLFFSCHSLN